MVLVLSTVVLVLVLPVPFLVLVLVVRAKVLVLVLRAMVLALVLVLPLLVLTTSQIPLCLRVRVDAQMREYTTSLIVAGKTDDSRSRVVIR